MVSLTKKNANSRFFCWRPRFLPNYVIYTVSRYKRCHCFFHNNFYKYPRIFMIFGTQLCKWILSILVNLLRWVPCTSLTWWRNVDVTEIMPFTVHVTLSPCCREKRQEFIPPKMWPPNLPDLNPVNYSIWVSYKRGFTVCGFMISTSAERVEAAGPHHHHGSDCVMA